MQRAWELGVRGTEERRAYKAVIDNKNGQSVDAYVHDLWQNGEWGQEISTEELKDELLGVLQSTPNGSLALKELADMSGVQADLEAQISLGKGDIQRKLEKVDANLAKNAQQMADFRKRINDVVQKLENGEPIDNTSLDLPNKETYRLSDEIDDNGRQFVLSSTGDIAFGFIEEASGLTPAPILLSEGLITNKETNDGYGLVHIEARHGDQIRKAGYPSVLSFIENVAKHYSVIRKGKDRQGNQTYMLQLTDKHNNTLMVELSGDGSYWNINTAGIFKMSYGKDKEVVYNRHTTDKQSAEIVGKSQSTELNGTQALSSMNIPTQSSSESKDTTSIPEKQISEEEIFNTPTLPTNEDIPFMIEPKPTEQAASEAEQNFEREVFDAFAGHLGETLGAESVVTDAAEANRVLEWHQGESPTL